MADEQKKINLEGLLDEISHARADSSESVSFDDVLQTMGQRSVGVLLLVPSLIALTPLGGIPGVPTVLAIAVFLLAGQLMINAKHVWLPGFVRRRRADAQKVESAMGYLRPGVRVVDKLLQPRIVWITKQPFVRGVAGLCMLMALTVPPLEIVPFAATVSWSAIAAFALALIANDGVLGLIATAISLGVFYTVAIVLL